MARERMSCSSEQEALDERSGRDCVGHARGTGSLRPLAAGVGCKSGRGARQIRCQIIYTIANQLTQVRNVGVEQSCSVTDSVTRRTNVDDLAALVPA